MRLVLRGLFVLEENLEKVNFTDEKFPHKKIDNKDIYVDCGATEDIAEDACGLRQYGDLRSLN